MLKAGRYVVIPTTFEPRREAKFMVRFFTESFANARFLKHDEPVHRFYHSLCIKCEKTPCYFILFFLPIHFNHGVKQTLLDTPWRRSVSHAFWPLVWPDRTR
jgi:hypothetical protein